MENNNMDEKLKNIYFYNTQMKGTSYGKILRLIKESKGFNRYVCCTFQKDSNINSFTSNISLLSLPKDTPLTPVSDLVSNMLIFYLSGTSTYEKYVIDKNSKIGFLAKEENVLHIPINFSGIIDDGYFFSMLDVSKSFKYSADDNQNEIDKSIKQSKLLDNTYINEMLTENYKTTYHNYAVEKSANKKQIDALRKSAATFDKFIDKLNSKSEFIVDSMIGVYFLDAFNNRNDVPNILDSCNQTYHTNIDPSSAVKDLDYCSRDEKKNILLTICHKNADSANNLIESLSKKFSNTYEKYEESLNNQYESIALIQQDMGMIPKNSRLAEISFEDEWIDDKLTDNMKDDGSSYIS